MSWDFSHSVNSAVLHLRKTLCRSHLTHRPSQTSHGASASGHTHNYAGSSSAGGNANAALKLATARTVSSNNGDFALSFNYDGSSNSTAFLS